MEYYMTLMTALEMAQGVFMDFGVNLKIQGN